MKSLEISVDHFDSDSDFDSDGQDLILNGCLDDNHFETHEQPNLSFVVDEASSESHDSQSEMTIPEDDTPSHSGDQFWSTLDVECQNISQMKLMRRKKMGRNHHENR